MYFKGLKMECMMDKISIAIDGPAGSGKSTVAKCVAKKMGITYLDTGAMYRAVTYAVISNNIAFTDLKSIQTIVENIEIDFIDGELHLNGENVSEAIRLPNINQNVSAIAAFGIVREKLVSMQKKIASNKSIVMDGRDIGTKVIPNASFKFFLTASIEERARRRYKEMINKGLDVDLRGLMEEIRMRDYEDTNRDISPLKQADDAILIDTTKYNIEEVVDCILKYAQ